MENKNKLEKRRLVKMNLDDELRDLQNGEMRYALNCRVGNSDNDNQGDIENTKGNVVVSFPLPIGTNKTIGAYEDKRNRKIYYFVYNSLNDHLLLQFDCITNAIDVVCRGEILNFNYLYLITGINIVELDAQNKLLYWTDDYNEPRKINVGKGITYFQNAIEFTNNQVGPGNILTLLINNTSSFAPGDQIAIQQFPGYTNESYNAVGTITKVYPTKIDINIPFGQTTLTAEGGLVIKLPTTGYYRVTDAELRRIKRPQLCGPEVQYGSDSTKTVNYLNNKLWEFAVRYIYDDKENSVLSPYSAVPYPVNVCGSTNSQNNYIDVTFEIGQEIVENIEIVARYNTYDPTTSQSLFSDFFSVVLLDKKSLNIPGVNPYNQKTTYSYKFYNDKIYAPVDVTDAIRLQDYVPLKSKAQELVDNNRIVDGNILEGYDPVDVVTRFKVDVEPSVSISSFNITGRVYIGNIFTTGGNGFMAMQPIHDGMFKTGASPTPCFGGFGQNGFGIASYEEEVVTDYKQSFDPGLCGFVMYLAGTDYYAVTQQVAPPSGVSLSSDSALAAKNVYSSDDPSWTWQTNADDLYDAINNNANIYSTYTINDIPEGIYVLRVASHHTTPSELTNGSRSYQKTSTYTTLVGGVYGHEIVIEVKTTNGVQQAFINGIQVSITNGTINISNTTILDLTDPDSILGGSHVTDGYVVGSSADNSGTTPADLLSRSRIHLATVFIESWWSSIISYNNLGQSSWVTKYANANSVDTIHKVFTDHNGFFFNTRPYTSTFVSLNQVKTGANLTARNTGDGIYEGNTYIGNGAISNNAETHTYIIPDSSPLLSTGSPLSVGLFSRTIIKGYIKDISGGIPSDVTIVYTRGQGYATTINKTDGSFQVVAYGDTVTDVINGISPLGYTRNDYLIFISNGQCIGYFDLNKILISLKFPGVNTANQYNFVNNYLLSNPTANLTYYASILNGLKRGASYQYGIVYYDHSIRNGFTQTHPGFYNDATSNNGMKVYVPYYTEKVNGNQVLGGRPVLTWAIGNQPPVWATHYQWVRTVRGAVGRYLQWSVNKVQYTDQFDVSTLNFQSGTVLKIEVQGSLGTSASGYAFRHPNSILSYSYTPGDRVRFIKQSNGAFFSDYFDIEIDGTKPNQTWLYLPNNSQLGPITPGTLIEIYNPRLEAAQEEDQFYFEMDECYEIGDAGKSTRYHKLGASTNKAISGFSAQNQNPQNTWEFGDNQYYNGTYNGVVVNSKVGFKNFNNVPHNFKVGDQIMVIQDIPENVNALLPLTSQSYNPQYNTLCKVIAVPGPFEIITNQPFLKSTPPQPGYIYTPAIGQFKNGDVYYKLREIPFTPTGSTNNASQQKTWFIEDDNFSDFWQSASYSKGRVNKKDIYYKQIRRPVTIYYSEVYVPSTQINGLSTVYGESFLDYEIIYGSIQRLNNINRMLDCYQELKVGRIPINQKIWKDTLNSPVVTISDNILNPIDYYGGEYGIGKNPESLAVYGFRRYFIDPNRGVFCRLSTDGITPISEHNFKAHNFFTDKCAAINATGKPYHIYTVYDQKFTECVIAFEEVVSGTLTNPEKVLVPGETISFNEDENTWASFYSYLPDFMVSNDTNIVTFKNGELWKHNENTVYNNFYGVQYTSQVWFPVNGEPSKEKVFQAISFEDADAWDVIAECPNGMVTDLFATDFETIKNMRYSPIWNDINSPNIYNVSNFNGKVMGQKMQDYVMLVKLISNQKTFQKLYAVNVLWTPAERSNK